MIVMTFREPIRVRLGQYWWLSKSREISQYEHDLRTEMLISNTMTHSVQRLYKAKKRDKNF